MKQCASYGVSCWWLMGCERCYRCRWSVRTAAIAILSSRLGGDAIGRSILPVGAFEDVGPVEVVRKIFCVDACAVLETETSIQLRKIPAVLPHLRMRINVIDGESQCPYRHGDNGHEAQRAQSTDYNARNRQSFAFLACSVDLNQGDDG